MRVLLGLAALSSLAFTNAQQSVTLSLASGAQPPISAVLPTNGVTSLATIYIFAQTQTNPNIVTPSNAQQLNSGSPQASNGNWNINVLNPITTLIWTFTTNDKTAQMQYRFTGYTGIGGGLAYQCDPCVSGNPVGTTGFTTGVCTSNTLQYGPVETPTTAAGGLAYNGFNCANFQRTFTYGPLVASTPTAPGTFLNSFGVLLFDRNLSPGPNQVSYSFSISRAANPIKGDPQIYGMQGQDFQVHGIPDEIFNLITYPNLQVNARFVYLSSAECHDNFTACFAHPGTYIGEEGIRLGNDKIHVKAGSFKKGLTVSVNGQRINGQQKLKLGSVDVLNHRRVIVNTPVMSLSISNSDKFLNQESALHDQKLLSLGSERRVLADGEQFHPEIPLHGLQGQTWRNVEYPSGLEYEGSINDYHVVDGNLYGSEFVFNQFKL